MPKKRVTLYLDSDTYDGVRETLAKTSDHISGLIDALLKDWHETTKNTPNPEDLSLEQRELVIHRATFRVFSRLVHETEQGLLNLKEATDSS